MFYCFYLLINKNKLLFFRLYKKKCIYYNFQFYRVKSIDNYLRRIRYLMRYSSIENSIAVLYNEIKADEEIQNIFKVNNL